eukprot:5910182-Alexandrium_andersonii.AAC.1
MTKRAGGLCRSRFWRGGLEGGATREDAIQDLAKDFKVGYATAVPLARERGTAVPLSQIQSGGVHGSFTGRAREP